MVGLSAVVLTDVLPGLNSVLRSEIMMVSFYLQLAPSALISVSFKFPKVIAYKQTVARNRRHFIPHIMRSISPQSIDVVTKPRRYIHENVK